MWGKQSGRTNALASIGIIILLCIIGFLVWWFGFRSNSNNNTQANQPTTQQKIAAIKSNWTTFFNGQTSAERKVQLLQNGQQYSQFIMAESQQPTAKATAATVSNVSLNGNNTATVTYTVYINKQPALKDQKSQAVLTNGVWKVSDAAFCSLLELGNAAPPNCPGATSHNASGSSSSGSGSNGQQSQTNSTTNSNSTSGANSSSTTQSQASQ